MKFKNLFVENLRNHTRSFIEFRDVMNIIHGFNGSGKTTLLEGLSICSLSRSFASSADSSLIRTGEQNFTVSANAENDLGIPYKVAVKYQLGSKKLISSTLGDKMSPKDIIGEIPLVVLSPDQKSITSGSPEDRRNFLDGIISQISRIYLDELIKFKKVLKQRNNILTRTKMTGSQLTPEFDLWTETLIKSATELIIRRNRFINDLQPYFTELYSVVSDKKENVGLEYCPNSLEEIEVTPGLDKQFVMEKLHRTSSKLRNEEARRGLTLFGPQKDEIKIMINDGVARDYASQGQHKSLLIALKFAELNIIREKKNETPVVLLDDIFSELDEKRVKTVLDMLIVNLTQTFITTTDPSGFREFLPDSEKVGYFRAAGGEIF